MQHLLLIAVECKEYREELVDFFSKRDWKVTACATLKNTQLCLVSMKVGIVIIDCCITDLEDGSLASTVALCRQKDAAVIIMNDNQTSAVERYIRGLGTAFYFVKPVIIDNLYAVVLKATRFREQKSLRRLPTVEKRKRYDRGQATKNPCY